MIELSPSQCSCTQFELFYFSLYEQQTVNNRLRAEVQLLHSSLEELKKLNTTLLDEHTALQLAFSSLEDKMRSVQVSRPRVIISTSNLQSYVIVVALFYKLYKL